MIDVMRDKGHRLGVLLCAMGMAKSPYEYQRYAMGRPDKYAVLHKRIADVFGTHDARWGSERIRAELRRDDRVHGPIDLRIGESGAPHNERRRPCGGLRQRQARLLLVQRRPGRAPREPGRTPLPCKGARHAVANRHHAVHTAVVQSAACRPSSTASTAGSSPMGSR